MDVARVERELASFWRKSAEEGHAVVRACAHNLVVVLQKGEDPAPVVEAISKLTETRPGRTLLVHAEGDEDGRLDAFASTNCRRTASGITVCSEQITIEAPGSERALVPRTVLQLLAADVPVFLWWRAPLAPRDPVFSELSAMADRVVVNSARSGGPPAQLETLRRLATRKKSRVKVGDLAWVRLESWREIVASCFDARFLTPLLRGVTRVEIAAGGPATRGGVTVPAAYMAGWLASRLGWQPGESGTTCLRPDGRPVRVDLAAEPGLPAGKIARVVIECGDAEPKATFVTERLAPDRTAVRSTVEIAGTCPLPRIQNLYVIEDAFLLSREFERCGEDPVFEAALSAAAAFVRGR